jgi:hypothetical protein
VGLVLDSTVVIAAERRGLTVHPFLEHIHLHFGDDELAMSAVTVAELSTLSGARKLRSSE